MSKIRLALYPFAILYDGITRFKNFLYSNDILKSNSFEIPLIVIGNLSVGGTGKTPHTEYVANLLKSQYKTAVLSRGYGRKTTGYLLADSAATAKTIGDEPLQIFNNIPEIDVAVCEDRTTGVRKLISENNSEVIILDDAFQHRKIQGSLYVLITTFQSPYYGDFVLPAGNLRETSSNKERANIIIVSKCPETLTKTEKLHIINRISPLPNQIVFFTSISYSMPIGFTDESKWNPNSKALLVTGIVNPEPLKNHLIQMGMEVISMPFKDHHQFSESDVISIQNKLKELGENAMVVTTSKDSVKLKDVSNINKINKRIFEIPIQINVLFNQNKEFQQTLLNHVSKI